MTAGAPGVVLANGEHIAGQVSYVDHNAVGITVGKRVRTIPRELEEAAQIDGASRSRIYWQIIFPLLRPVLFAAGVVLWVYVWNDFFYAFFLLDGASKQTLPLGLFSVVSSNSHSTNWNCVFADVIVVSLPLVLVFMIGQRRILAGVMAGGVKG